MAGDVTVRILRTLEDISPIERLQATIWGYENSHAQVYPARGLFAFSESGGLVGGAFDGKGDLVGFSAAWIGREHDHRRLHLHSQIVGVAEPYRDLGVGRLLKLQQREFALEHGLPLVKWTFDPTRPRNAYFNLHKLGAVARHFVPDYYGTFAGSLNAGRATDRLWAEWHVGSAHVQRRLEPHGHPPDAPAGELVNHLTRRGAGWAPPEFTLDLTAPTLLVDIPADLDAATPAAQAFLAELQPRLRLAFTHYLPHYTITDCLRRTDRVTYLLQKGVPADLARGTGPRR